MSRWIWVLGVVVAMGCEDEPCQRYVDYMCACHAEDEGFSCEELQATFSNPDSEVSSQCAIDLSDQQADDDANGLECAI